MNGMDVCLITNATFLLYVSHLLLHYSWYSLTANLCQNSITKCWNKLVLLVVRFVLSFIKVLKILRLFRQDQGQDFFFKTKIKTKTFISRPRLFFMSSRCLETKTKVLKLHPWLIVDDMVCITFIVADFFSFSGCKAVGEKVCSV